MYTPEAFAERRPAALYGLMRAHPLATVVIAHPAQGLVANLLPWSVDEEQGLLRGHVARGNPLWQLVGEGHDALSLFQGPQAYVSPSLYPSKAEHGRVVPTWNYAVVQAHGRLRAVTDRDWLHALVNTLTDGHEAGRARPWKVDDAPSDYLDGMLRAIVGLEFRIERLEGKFKLSQNRDERDRDGVLRGLAGSALGDLMAAGAARDEA